MKIWLGAGGQVEVVLFLKLDIYNRIQHSSRIKIKQETKGNIQFVNIGLPVTPETVSYQDIKSVLIHFYGCKVFSE